VVAEAEELEAVEVTSDSERVMLEYSKGVESVT
jgi:hypothetical protein